MTTEITSPREFLKETIKLKIDTESAFLELAARLYKIHNENLWKGEYSDYEEFLLDARISKATASKLESVYSVFVLKHRIQAQKLAQVGWSSLYAISSHADTKERATELVERAGLLTRGDLENSLKNEKNPGCKHSWQELHLRQCTECGIREKIYNEK